MFILLAAEKPAAEKKNNAHAQWQSNFRITVTFIVMPPLCM